MQKAYNGFGPFTKMGREFDGGVDSRWFEAKSGAYWEKHARPGPGFEKFKSDIGSKLRISREHKATLEVHSSSPIPPHIKKWLEKKKVPFFEY